MDALDEFIGGVWGDSDVVDVLSNYVCLDNGVKVFSKKTRKSKSTVSTLGKMLVSERLRTEIN